MSGGVTAFGDLFDAAVMLADKLRTMTPKSIPVQFLAECKRFFDAISKVSKTSKKILMLDVSAARGKSKDRKISGIGSVCTAQNVADGLSL